VTTINLIKNLHSAITCSSTFGHHLFQQFLLETETEHGDVFLYTEVRCLSKGKMHKCFFELCIGIQIFLTEKGKFNYKLSDPD
jgi:hypothetical protein